MCHAFRQTWALSAVLRARLLTGSGGLVTDGRKLRVWWALSRDANCLSHLAIDRRLTWCVGVVLALMRIGSGSLLIGLASSLFLLLLCLPLLADLLELFWSSLRAVRLHCDVSVQMVESAVGLLAAIPAALVHTLNLLVAATGALMLLSTWDGDERIDGRERVSARRGTLDWRDHCWSRWP